MKTALVMGITGGFGSSVAQVLARQGWSIRALLRDKSRLPERFAGAEVIEGDAADFNAVRRAAQGVDLLVYAVNPPAYNWNGRALPMLDNAARVAEEQGLTLLFPGNVYVFDPADGPDFAEQAELRPLTSKGAIRKAMEQRLRQASESGARVILLRMGDYIGEHAPSAWFGALVKHNRSGITVGCPGPADLVHTWAYLPDAARAAVALVQMQDALPAWGTFHFRGYRMSLRQLADTLAEVAGQPVRLKDLPWWAFRLMAPFSTLFRGLLEMRYLWHQPVNLDNAKLERYLGHPEPHTPVAQALVDSGVVDKLRNEAHTAY